MTKHDIVSPMPGIFYRSPGPGKPPYVNEGDKVAVGQAIGLVEIMKQFNEVKSTAAGTIAEFLVDDYGELEPGSTIAVVTED